MRKRCSTHLPVLLWSRFTTKKESPLAYLSQCVRCASFRNRFVFARVWIGRAGLQQPTASSNIQCPGQTRSHCSPPSLLAFHLESLPTKSNDIILHNMIHNIYIYIIFQKYSSKWEIGGFDFACWHALCLFRWHLFVGQVAAGVRLPGRRRWLGEGETGRPPPRTMVARSAQINLQSVNQRGGSATCFFLRGFTSCCLVRV